MKPQKFDVRLYDAVSEGLQRRVGVDPAQCLKIVEIRTSRNRRTDLGTFLRCIVKREWATPKKGEPNQHDSSVHKWHIRNAHPVVVDVLAFIASQGVELLQEDADAAEKHASAIDHTLSFDGFRMLIKLPNQFIFDSGRANDTWEQFSQFAMQMYASQGSAYFDGVTDDFPEVVRSIQTAHAVAMRNAEYPLWQRMGEEKTLTGVTHTNS